MTTRPRIRLIRWRVEYRRAGERYPVYRYHIDRARAEDHARAMRANAEVRDVRLVTL